MFWRIEWVVTIPRFATERHYLAQILAIKSLTLRNS